MSFPGPHWPAASTIHVHSRRMSQDRFEGTCERSALPTPTPSHANSPHAEKKRARRPPPLQQQFSARRLCLGRPPPICLLASTPYDAPLLFSPVGEGGVVSCKYRDVLVGALVQCRRSSIMEGLPRCLLGRVHGRAKDELLVILRS